MQNVQLVNDELKSWFKRQYEVRASPAATVWHCIGVVPVEEKA